MPNDEATRRTESGHAEAPPPVPAGSGVRVDAIPAASAVKTKRRFGWRFLRAALLVIALIGVVNEMRFAAEAQRLAAIAPTQELDETIATWKQYDRLRARSMRSRFTGLERALTEQTMILAERVFGNYRMPQPTVREAQWRTVREAISEALGAAPGDTHLKAALRYCDGHLHRINGEARKSKKLPIEAKQEFTDAVTAFREAAELRPDWPDPFLGLMRTFIYGLEDVDHGADALQQAQRLGYPPGDRETVQLADGYRARAETFARTAHTLAGMPQEQEYLTRAADGYRQALELYAKAIDFGDAPRNIRATQRRLTQVEERLKQLSPQTTPE